MAHFTSCAPERWDGDDQRDWVHLALSMRNAHVHVHTVLFETPGGGRNLAAAYHNVMSAITDSPYPCLGVAIPETLGAHLAAISDGRRSAERLPSIRVPEDMFERFRLAGMESAISDVLFSVAEDDEGIPPEIRGLVRLDAVGSRSAREWTSELKVSAVALRESLAETILHIRDEDPPVDCVSSSGLDELLEEFVSEPLPDFPELFWSVAKIVVGIPIHAPFASKTGKFNYQSAYGALIQAVREGYTVSYGSFSDYYEFKAGRVTTRRDLRRGVDDFVLRDQGQVTGVLPVASSPLSSAVIRQMAATPWLDAVTWHSLCRHFIPPPNAAGGVLACALWTAIGSGTCSDANTRAIVDTLRIVPPKSSGPEASKAAAWVCCKRRWSEETLRLFSKEMARFLPPGLKGSSVLIEVIRSDGSFRPTAHHDALTTECLERGRRLARASGIDEPGWTRDQVMAEILAASYPAARAVRGSTAAEVLEAMREASKPVKIYRRPKEGSSKLLPVPGSKRFNRRLEDLVVAVRRKERATITGRKASSMTSIWPRRRARGAGTEPRW